MADKIEPNYSDVRMHDDKARRPGSELSERAKSERTRILVDGYQHRRSDARWTHFGRTADGRWLYTAVTAGQHLALTDGTQIDIDAIFAGVFDLPGD